MAKVTRGPDKQPGERWLGEGIVGLIPFKPKATKSSAAPSSESEEQDPMAPAVEAYEKAGLELMRQAGVTDGEGESTP